MKMIILSFFLFCWATSVAQLENDKVLHFVGGNLYGLAGAGIAKQISKGNRLWTFTGALVGSTLIGVGKEAIDASDGGSGWDNDDLLATVLGGATVGITIDIFTGRGDKRKQRPRGGLTVENTIGIDWANHVQGNGLPSLSQMAMPQLFVSE